MAHVVQRMAQHTKQLRRPCIHGCVLAEGPPRPPTTGQVNLGKYLSSINLNAADTFEFPLKTLPRPKGKATQVIYTMYDLPRPDSSPHDEVFDAQGNVWVTRLQFPVHWKLDPKTGKAVEYPVPQNRLARIAQGGLQIDIDKEGRIYFGNMSQMQIVRFRPQDRENRDLQVSVPESDFGDGHLTMIDPAFQNEDGKIWANVAFATGKAGARGMSTSLPIRGPGSLTRPAVPALKPTTLLRTRRTTSTACR